MTKTDPTAAREADLKHRKKINNEALSTISKVIGGSGIDCKSIDLAKDVVEAIAKGEIPHVSIKY